MQELIEKIAASEGSGLLLAGVALIVGIALWAAGRRMLRTAFGAGGLLVGVVAGLALSEVPRVAEVGIPAWVIVLITGLLIAVMCAAAYKLALAAAIGLLLGAIAPVGVLAAAEKGWIEIEQGDTLVGQPPPVQDVLAMPPPPPLDESGVLGTEGVSDTDSTAAEDLPKWREWIIATWDAVTAAPKRIWEQSPDPLRWIVVAASGSGVIVGLVLGAAAPSLAATLVTSLFGSLLILGSGWTFAVKLNAPEGWMPQSSMQWLVWWGIAAIIGLGLQWIFRAKPADK